MMLAVRQQISGIHPAKSRWSMAFVKRVSVCSRLRVRIWTQTTEIM